MLLNQQHNILNKTPSEKAVFLHIIGGVKESGGEFITFQHKYIEKVEKDIVDKDEKR